MSDGFFKIGIVLLAIFGALYIVGAYHRDERRIKYVDDCKAGGAPEWQCRAMFK